MSASAGIYMARDVSRYMARVLRLGGSVQLSYKEREVEDGETQRRFTCRMQVGGVADEVTGSELAPCVEATFGVLQSALIKAADTDVDRDRSTALDLLKRLTTGPMP